VAKLLVVQDKLLIFKELFCRSALCRRFLHFTPYAKDMLLRSIHIPSLDLSDVLVDPTNTQNSNDKY
jgi:hypothetical protein